VPVDLPYRVGFVNSVAPDFQGNPELVAFALGRSAGWMATDEGHDRSGTCPTTAEVAVTCRYRRSRPDRFLKLAQG